MSVRSKIYSLPLTTRYWLESELVSRDHGSFRALSRELKEKGYDIPPMTIARHSKKMREKAISGDLQTIRSILSIVEVLRFLLLERVHGNSSHAQDDTIAADSRSVTERE